MLLKIGQLARQTGLTVRTLHHYDAIGLLRPSGRTDNGYRLYDGADVARLFRIQALRRLGLSLEETGATLDREDADVNALVARQVAQLNRQIADATRLRDRLLRLQDDVAADTGPALHDWLAMLELMARLDDHLTPAETDRWHAHMQDSRGTETAEWKALTGRVRDLVDAAVPADDPRALDCARRWLALQDPHVKRSPLLMMKVDALYREDPALQAALTADRAMIDFVRATVGQYRLGVYARHLDPAQLAALRPRYLRHQGRADWVTLSRDLYALLEAGTPPDHPDAAAPCLRWRSLFEDCFGSDPAVAERVLHAQATDPDLALGSALDAPLLAWLRAGLAHLGRPLGRTETCHD